MADDLLINKTATIERYISRIREEYDGDEATFSRSHTRQDAAILNIQQSAIM